MKPRRQEFSFWLEDPSDAERLDDQRNAEPPGQFLLASLIVIVIAALLLIGAAWYGHQSGLEAAAQPIEQGQRF